MGPGVPRTSRQGIQQTPVGRLNRPKGMPPSAADMQQGQSAQVYGAGVIQSKGAPQSAIANRFNNNVGRPNTGNYSDSDLARQQEDALYKDILDSHKNAWSDIEKGHVANMATMQRRSAAINAAMGRSIGGGFWANLGQAQISGQNQLDQAKLQHEQQGRNLQLDWLDKMIRRREGDEGLAERAAGAESGVPGGAGVSVANGTYTQDGKVYAY